MLFFSEYILNKYGRPLYRVPIDLPLSCPHRVKGGGKGCLYCPEDGSRARHLKNHLNLGSQVRRGIEYVRTRYGKDIGLIAYFQSFTNTNAPVQQLKEYYREVLESADFAMLIISTRPDCLPEDVLEYLSELNEKYDLWIELGVQTANDKTLAIINRQHDFQCVKDAVAKLAARNIKTAAHVILGLPGEGIGEFRKTASELAKQPFSGIKVHNLLVLKNTPLAGIYHDQQLEKDTDFPKIEPMNEYEYADALIEFLKLIPPDWPLMRITADAPPEDIIAPKWWMKKGQFIEYIRERMEDNANIPTGMPKVKTGDGSYTLYHPEYRQHFHSLAGAATEAEKKFLEPCEIRKALREDRSLKILDIGFGLGTNALAAIKAAEEIKTGKLLIVSLERDQETIDIAAALDPKNEILSCLAEELKWNSSSGISAGQSSSIEIILGDARQSISTLKDKFNAVFLDPFSPDTNPELWTYDFIRKLSSLLTKEGVIATYSASFPVRGAMLRCGLAVGETPSFGRKKGGTIASFAKEKVKSPLPLKEQNIIGKSTAGTPYRDPFFSRTRPEICEFRKKLIQRLQVKGIPKWYKE